MTRRTQQLSLVLGLLAFVTMTRCGDGRAPNAPGAEDAGVSDASTEDAGNGSCQLKYDCPTGNICVLSKCQPPPAACRSDAECPVGLICGLDGVCGAGCSDSRDCLSPLICDHVRATCDVCSRSNPCPPGLSCLAGSCRPMTGCQTTADCLAANDGEICVNGSCSPCATDADCNVAPYNTQGRRCERGICSLPGTDGGMGGCNSRYECPTGQICYQQRCTNPSTGCQSNADCPVGRICGPTGLCQPGCADIRDCAPNQTCNTATGTCQMTGGCDIQACKQQCASQNQQCDPMSCTCTGAMCDINACTQQCASQNTQCDPMTCTCTGTCDVNACQQRCTAQGLQCDPATCGCTGSSGGMCQQASDCASTDVCSGGTCSEQAVSASGGGCSLIECLLGSFGIGSPCVGATTGTQCGCQSAFSNLGSGNFNGPFACQ